MAIPAIQVACPNCSTRLRVRDKSFAGRTVNCPDCRQPLTIQLAPTGELVALRAESSASGPAAQSPATERSPRRRRTAVIVAASLLALLICAALVMFALPRGKPATAAQVAESPPANALPSTPLPAAPPDATPQPPPPVAAADPAPQSLVTATPASEPQPSAVEPSPASAPDTGPDAEPITVFLAADEPVFDINAVLNQPLVEFSQPTPKPAAEILKVVGELSGLAVDLTQLDTAAASRLEKPITLALHNTSVRGVLDATVAAAGLTYSLGNGTVVVIDGGAGAPGGSPAKN